MVFVFVFSTLPFLLCLQQFLSLDSVVRLFQFSLIGSWVPEVVSVFDDFREQTSLHKTSSVPAACSSGNLTKDPTGTCLGALFLLDKALQNKILILFVLLLCRRFIKHSISVAYINEYLTSRTQDYITGGSLITGQVTAFPPFSRLPGAQ